MKYYFYFLEKIINFDLSDTSYTLCADKSHKYLDNRTFEYTCCSSDNSVRMTEVLM